MNPQPLYLHVRFGKQISYELKDEFNILETGVLCPKILGNPVEDNNQLDYCVIAQVARLLERDNILVISWYRRTTLFSANIYYYEPQKGWSKIKDERLCLSPGLAKHPEKVLAIYRERVTAH